MAQLQKKTSREFGWNLAQRRALIYFLSVFLAFLGVQYALHRAYVTDPQPPQGARAGELASKIDPNVADWQTLAAIPTLGEKRAREIVAYRDRMQHLHPDQRVFTSPADLRNIKGIGPAMEENLQPYLTFEADGAPTMTR